MKFEIRNVKYSAFHSQETHCFEATLYVDDKKAFGVTNDGWGGCDSYYKVKGGVANPNLYAAQIDEELAKEEIESEFGGLTNSLEIVVGNLVNEYLAAKEIKKVFRRICYVKDDCNHGEYYRAPARVKPNADGFAQLRRQAWWRNDYVILNELPADELKKYI